MPLQLASFYDSGGAARHFPAKYLLFADAKKNCEHVYVLAENFFEDFLICAGAKFLFFRICISKFEQKHNPRKSGKLSDIIYLDHIYISSDFIYSVCICLHAIICIIFCFLFLQRIFFKGFCGADIFSHQKSRLWSGKCTWPQALASEKN